MDCNIHWISHIVTNKTALKTPQAPWDLEQPPANLD